MIVVPPKLYDALKRLPEFNGQREETPTESEDAE